MCIDQRCSFYDEHFTRSSLAIIAILDLIPVCACACDAFRSFVKVIDSALSEPSAPASPRLDGTGRSSAGHVHVLL